jgi:eukaryotic-like serine/threonine-protein kinase
MTAITGEFVLPGDVVLAPVASLPEQLRAQLEAEEGDFAVSRRGSRSASRIVDAEGAELLERFRSPSTIVEVVIAHSRDHGTGAETTLEEAYPLVQRLIAAGVLVPAGTDAAQELRPAAGRGDRLAGYEVITSIQVLEDTELHQVRTADGTVAALKLFKRSGRIGQLAGREAAVLRELDGAPAPRLLEAGDDHLLLEWVRGIPAPAAAAEMRRAGGRRALLDLCLAVVRAYVCLHARGVVHSDVHPSNVLVAGDGSVTLLDFGVARVPASENPQLAHAPRAGMPFFFEPEYAAAIRARRRPPPSNERGEQYAVAALLYQLVTGVHYLDFSLQQDEMLRQIAEESPLPLRDPWPELEDVLAIALRKDPGERHQDLATLERRLAALERPDTPAVDLRHSHKLLDAMLRRLGPDGPYFPERLPTAPTCSVNYGAAGVAYALYRVSALRDDPELLALADVWISRALAHRDDADAWYSPDLDVTPERVGTISSFHTAAGAYSVAALVAHARGDTGGRRLAVEAMLRASAAPCEELDLTLGRTSTVLACAMLLEAIGTADPEAATALKDLGDRVLAGVWKQVDGYAAIPECEQFRYLGVAHGWAGVLYATLRWSELTGAPPPATTAQRLDELAGCAEPSGRGLRWKVLAGSSDQYMNGWCNGSAGYVHLWTLAHRLEPNDRWLDLAHGAAWNAWELDGPVSTVCCGRAGRAYALLNLYRHTDDPAWLTRARVLADRAAAESAPGESEGHEDSLYKGRLGPALLAADQAAPHNACLPFFEPEGWPAAELAHR